MLIYLAGVRHPELRLTVLPEYLLMTWADIGPFGDEEQRLPFDDLLRQRGSDLKVPSKGKNARIFVRRGGDRPAGKSPRR